MDTDSDRDLECCVVGGGRDRAVGYQRRHGFEEIGGSELGGVEKNVGEHVVNLQKWTCIRKDLI